MQNLKDFLFLAVLDEREEAFVGTLSDEVVGVRSFFEEDLHHWVQARLHDPFETDEHLVERDQADAADSRAERICQLDQGAYKALELIHCAQDQALVVLADPADDVARLELHGPVLAVDSLPFRDALFEFFFRLLERLELFEGHVVNLT